MILSIKNFIQCSIALSARHVFISAFVAQRSFASTTAATTTAQMTATTNAAADCAAASTLTFEEHSKSYSDLLERLREITHLNHASAVLNYDR
jgi:hypothetical protein